MPYLRANNCDFYFETFGSGAPIIFLHGETHSAEVFRDQAVALSDKHQCIIYDRRGHGRSQVAPYGYSLWNQSYDLKCILDKFKFETVIVVAVAMSTTIAVTLALNNPSRVRGLVLCSWYELDGYPAFEQRRKQYQMSFGDLHMLMLDIMQREGRRGLEQYIEDNYRTLLPILPPDKPDVRKRLIQILSSHSPAHYPQTGEFCTSIPPLTPRLKELTCPVLGICGTNDPSPDLPELFGKMSNFREAWIEDARRFSMMEYPDRFNRVLREFIDLLP